MHWIDPDHLPETSGVVGCFLLNEEGEADGLVLTDGTEVHIPPHVGRAVLEVVWPGTTVHVRGVRLRGDDRRRSDRPGRGSPHRRYGAAERGRGAQDAPQAGACRVVCVRARDAHGRDEDHCEPARSGWTPPARATDGSDRDRIGPWPEKGLLDTQLGPNRNGRKW